MYTSIPLGALNFNYNRPTFELQTATALSSDQQYSKCSLDCANLYIGQEEAVPTLSESAITAQIFASSSAAKSDWFVQQNDPPSLNVWLPRGWETAINISWPMVAAPVQAQLKPLPFMSESAGFQTIRSINIKPCASATFTVYYKGILWLYFNGRTVKKSRMFLFYNVLIKKLIDNFALLKKGGLY